MESARRRPLVERHTGLRAPELSCWLVLVGCTARVMPQVNIGDSGSVGVGNGEEPFASWMLAQPDVARATRGALVHTHPPLSENRLASVQSGVSAADALLGRRANEQLRGAGSDLACDVVSIDVLTCTTSVFEPETMRNGRLSVRGTGRVPVSDVINDSGEHVATRWFAPRVRADVMPRGTMEAIVDRVNEIERQGESELETDTARNRAELDLFDLRQRARERGVQLQPPLGERLAENRRRVLDREASTGATGPGETGGTGSSVSGGGGVVGPDDLINPGGLDALRDQSFAGGDPTRVGTPDLAAASTPDPAPPVELDPDDIDRGEVVVPPVPDTTAFPTRVPGLTELLHRDGDAGPRFTSPVRPQDLGTPDRPHEEEPVRPPTAARPGSRVGVDGQVQTWVGGEDLFGDARDGTTPGRVDFYRAPDGTTEAVIVSPRRTDPHTGTDTLWTPNLGPSLASNPAARHVTSVQRVTTPRVLPGTTSRVTRIRTGEHTRSLAGTGGPGSTPGTVTYRPVPGNPALHDVIVEPSVTETGNPDGSTTLTYSALRPANRRLNTRGLPERFRVAVDTPMVETEPWTVHVPAPRPAPDLSPDPAPAAVRPVHEPAHTTPGYEPSPALTGNSRAATAPDPAHVAPTPEPGMRGEPRAGRLERPDPAKLDAGLLPEYTETGEIAGYVSSDPAVRQIEGQVNIPHLGPAPGVGLTVPVPVGGQLAPAH